MNKLKLKSDFENRASLWGDAINNGDHRSANRMYKSLIKKITILETDKSFAEETLHTLLEHPVVAVKYWAAIGLLLLQIDTQNGEIVLKEIDNDPASGPVGAMAKVSLLEWMRRKAINRV